MLTISEIRIKLADPGNNLLAFCSIVIDNACVLHDLKIIDGRNGLFVSMPCRKRTDHCHRCRSKNHLLANFCNQCGTALGQNRVMIDESGRRNIHQDIFHPINSGCREAVQAAIIKAYKEEVERSKQSGYVCTYGDFGDGVLDGDEPPSYGRMMTNGEK